MSLTLKKMFLTVQDADARLRGCTFRYKNTLVMVHAVEPTRNKHEYLVLCTTIPSTKELWIDLNDLDLSPLPLGNINKQNAVYYLSRKPARMWKNGLVNDNLHVRAYPKMLVRVGSNDPALVSPVMNEYPSMAQCVEHIEKGFVSNIAFSRHFSIHDMGVGDWYLLYKCRDVIGTVSAAKKSFKLEKQFIYFKEMLQEESKHDYSV